MSHADNGGEERHENRGRDARRDPEPVPASVQHPAPARRMKAEHYGAIVLTGLLGGGQAKSILSSSDLSAQVVAQGVELGKKIDAQAATLNALQLALVELKAQRDAERLMTERLASEVARQAQDTRDLRDGMVRGATRQDEFDRRITSIEQERKK